MAWAERNGELYDLYIGAEGGVAAPEDCTALFHAFKYVRSIRCNGAFHTENVRSMRDMFSYCWVLEDVDTGGFDTAAVTDMQGMFAFDNNLAELDTGGWDTGAVTDMYWMFMNCQNLAELDVSTWDTGAVADMCGLFGGCESLTRLDVENWDTGSVTDMASLFSSCASLTALDLSDWDLSQVKAAEYMFYGCGSLETLDLDGWDLAGIGNTEGMFKDCAVPESAAGCTRGGKTDPPAPHDGQSTPSDRSKTNSGQGTKTDPPKATSGQSGGAGTSPSAGSRAVLQDPDAFFQNKLVRAADQTTDTGGLVYFVTNDDHDAFQEYADYLLGGSFPLELADSASNQVSKSYYINYTGGDTVKKATTGSSKPAYDLVLVITKTKATDRGQLNIFYGEGFTFSDFGGRCTDTSFRDRSGGNTKTGHWGPGSGSSDISSSSPGAGGSTGVSCAFCDGGHKTCGVCEDGYVMRYVSGGGYDGAAPGTWKQERCTTCDGKGWVTCPVCRGRGIVGG